jgi:uncharacterized membrane protein YfcA
MTWVYFILIGLLAGTLSGLLGIGGGIIIIPCLVMVFQQLDFPPLLIIHLAMATSLASIVFTSAATSFYQYQRKAIQWEIWKQLLPGLLVGVVLGVIASDAMHAQYLHQGFSILLLLIALKMGIGKIHGPFQSVSGKVYLLCGVVVGALSGLFGLGGGVLLVPLLQYFSVPIKLATATSSACLWPTVVLGSILQVIVGWGEESLPIQTLGYVYWPAAVTIGIASMLSTKFSVGLAHALPKRWLERLFAIVLVVVALKMWTVSP